MLTALLNLILLSILQFFAGTGLLAMFKIRLKPWIFLPIALLTGLAAFSFLPFLLQLFYLPLTAFNISLSLVILSWLVNIPLAKRLEFLRDSLSGISFRFKLYEIPPLLLIAFIVAVSIWRCYYYPPTPRDLTSGAEVIAEYAIREKTMINSVFSLNLESTNNPFKPPFITCLQIIYKYAGFSFGQIWLSIVFVCFLVFLYQVLSTYLHKLFSALLLLFFLAIPEMYAYTFMALFDYSNAVFFCLSLYFLFEYFKNGKTGWLAFSGLLMGIATYIRSETLLLVPLIAITLFVHYWRKKNNWKNLIIGSALLLIPATLIYILSVTIYIGFYLPVKYPVGNLLRANLWNPLPLIQRFGQMNDQILFSKSGMMLFGYFIYVFVGVLLVDAVWKEKWDTRSLNWLFGALVVYLGLPFIAFLFPLFDLDHTTKRGLFKIFPLMLLYMGNSRFLIHLSERIREWEKS